MTVRSRELPVFLDAGPRRRPAAPASAWAVPVEGRRVPGEAGLWVFLLGDMTLFGLFFAVFAAQMSARREEWAASAGLLHDDIGMVNTLVLLVSSYLIARSVAARHQGRARRARTFMTAAACLGLCFAGTKAVEYALLIGEGISPAQNLFFTYYFALTGIHLLHVVIGVAVLLVCARRIGDVSTAIVEGSASYWHMVDVLWVVLFPLLYFIGRV
ncbi:MAG TPA: cytochrome c oxidase subunit 3 [Microbacterium sp.]|nr:cytochrome c oxidase subunit 3 [Microbacterium sp.]